jgi:glycosyltransferase involved in cell wall biosynthesis
MQMKQKLHFEISDLIFYFKFHNAPSGIQRVQLEIIRHFLGREGEHEEANFVIASSAHDEFAVVDRLLAIQIVDMIDHGKFNRSELNELIHKLTNTAKPRVLDSSAILFVSGAFWVSPTIVACLWNAKQNGARTGILCYDLIPLRNPEFCSPPTSALFVSTINNICTVVDFIITISGYVKIDVDRYLSQLGISIPVVAVPLAHEIKLRSSDAQIEHDTCLLMDRPYVLFVSTIEARKNHAYAFRVWKRLHERNPELTPNLIFVGREGWLVNDLMQQMKSTNWLDGKLKIVNELPDSQLIHLYKQCLFTIYPSFAEGWGLPVAESLVFQKLSIVSKNTSLPEVGGDFVHYIDPDNVSDGVNTISALLDNPRRIRAAEKHIREKFKPRLWAEVGKDMLAAFEQIERLSLPTLPLPSMLLLPGISYPISGQSSSLPALITGAQQLGLEQSFSRGWYTTEHWGKWMMSAKGTITMRLPDASNGTIFRFKLQIHVFHGWTGKQASIFCQKSGLEAVFEPVAGQRISVTFDLPVSAKTIEFELRADSESPVSELDQRRLSLGIAAIGYSELTDQHSLFELSKNTSDWVTLHLIPKYSVSSSIIPRHHMDVLNMSWKQIVLRRAVQEGIKITLARGFRYLSRRLSGGKIT